MATSSSSASTSDAAAAGEKRWFLYVLRCADGSLYCGISTDVKRRLQQHNAGTGARYTRGRGPVKLLRRWQAASHGAALRAERWFKKLNREQKEARLQSRTRSDGLARCLRALPLG